MQKEYSVTNKRLYHQWKRGPIRATRYIWAVRIDVVGSKEGENQCCLVTKVCFESLVLHTSEFEQQFDALFLSTNDAHFNATMENFRHHPFFSKCPNLPSLIVIAFDTLRWTLRGWSKKSIVLQGSVYSNHRFWNLQPYNLTSPRSFCHTLDNVEP